MARRNVLSAIDAYQTADGGLETIHSVLGRMRELAVQASNEHLGDSERSHLQQEIRELIQSVETTSEQTRFNGVPLLVKDSMDVAFVVDSSASMNPMINTLKANVSAFEADLRTRGFDVEFGLAELNSNRDPVDGLRMRSNIGAGDFVTQLNSLTTVGGAMDPVSGILEAIGEVDTAGASEPDAFTWRDGARRMLIYLTDTGRETTLNAASEQDAGNAAAARTVTVNIIGEFNNDDRDGVPGSDLDELASLSGGAYYDRGNAAGDQIAAALSSISDSVAGTAGRTDLRIQVDVDAQDRIEAGFSYDARASALGITDVNVSTAQGARAALELVDVAIDRTSTLRADVGSSINRLRIADANLSVRNENLAASVSRMVDADLAGETAALVRDDMVSSLALQALTLSQNIQRDSVLALIQG